MDSITQPSVSVVTVTRNREESLLRCIESVEAQDYEGPIIHVVIGDESAVLLRLENAVKERHRMVHVHHVNTTDRAGEFLPFYVPSRLAYLRNLGSTLVDSSFIAYLDDDNTFEPSHLSSLVATVQSEPGIDVAYSWRKLLYSDGSSYTAEAYPWTPKARMATSQDALSRHIYDSLVAGGIRTPGDPTVRDALIDAQGCEVFTVDTNELLISREVLTEIPNVVHYEWREMVGDYSDDYAWVRRCYRNGIRFKSSGRVTVNYTIGGVSNHAS